MLFDSPARHGGGCAVADEPTRLRVGDLFTDPLTSCCYLVMHVLHDWSDGETGKILRAIHRAAPPDATLLVLESIVPADPPGASPYEDGCPLFFQLGEWRVGIKGGAVPASTTSYGRRAVWDDFRNWLIRAA